MKPKRIKILIIAGSITGPFGKPAIGTVSTVETLMGPILNLFGKTKHLIQGDNCEVFYNGSVPQP